VAEEKGSWMALAASALYAYTVVLGRRAVLLSSPLHMAAVYPLLLMVSVVAIAVATRRASWGWLKRPGPALAVGACLCTMAVCHYLAISMVQASYMVGVKRLSLLFAMVYGGMLLGETRLAQHLAAGCLMLIGSGLILFWG